MDSANKLTNQPSIVRFCKPLLFLVLGQSLLVLAASLSSKSVNALLPPEL